MGTEQFRTLETSLWCCRRANKKTVENFIQGISRLLGGLSTTLFGTCLVLRNDFELIRQTSTCAHLRSISITHLTKEFASLLRDQHLRYDSFLAHRFNIHGSETIFRPNDIVRGYTSIDGPLGRYAQHLGFFEIVENKNRKYLSPINIPDVDINTLVEDAYLFFEEALILGKLDLVEKIVLAGHRSRAMTIQNHREACGIFLRDLRTLKNKLQSRQYVDLKKYVDRMNECADELVKKVEYYPKRVSRLKQKLDSSSNVAASLLASQLHEGQLDFSKELKVSILCLRSSHLIRSLLYETGIYPLFSKSAEIEYHRFRQTCGVSDLTFAQTSSPLPKVNFVLDYLENEILNYLDS
jgi:hypothetical protein